MNDNNMKTVDSLTSGYPFLVPGLQFEKQWPSQLMATKTTRSHKQSLCTLVHCDDSNYYFIVPHGYHANISANLLLCWVNKQLSERN